MCPSVPDGKFLAMHYGGGANPAQLAMLTRVLDEFCREHRIELIRERENAAAMIMCLYQQGYETADDLKLALEMAGSIH